MFAFVRILKSKDTDTSPKLDNDATSSSLYKDCEKSSWKWLQIKLDIPNVATSPPMSAIWEVITIFPAFTGRGSIDRRDRIGSSRCSLTGPSHVHQRPDKDRIEPKGPPCLRHPGHGNPCSDWLGIVSVLGLCAAQCCRLLLTTFTSVC